MAQRRSTRGPLSSKDGCVSRSQEVGELKFLTFTDFAQTTKPETKRQVRSHVMSRVQKQFRDGKREAKKNQIELVTSPLVQDVQGNDDQSGEGAVIPHPRDMGSGRSDPFAQYPIDMSIRTHELFDHCKRSYLGSNSSSILTLPI